MPKLVPAEVLSEELSSSLNEVTMDRPTQRVRGVVLLGPESRNGYRYPADAMERALPLYEGRPVFLDHAEGPAQSTRRRLRDYAGQIQNPRMEGNRILGDLHLMGPHTDWLLNLVESAPKDIGMSHVALGRRSSDGSVIEQIDKVISVDIVAFPAATTSFRESTQEEVEQLLQESTLPESWKAAVKELALDQAEPARFLETLQKLHEVTKPETPRSSEKHLTSVGRSYSTASSHLRKALVTAIKG